MRSTTSRSSCAKCVQSAIVVSCEKSAVPQWDASTSHSDLKVVVDGHIESKAPTRDTASDNIILRISSAGDPLKCDRYR